VIGLLALLVAAVVGTKVLSGRFERPHAATRARQLLNGRSLWVAGTAGLGIALPSVDVGPTLASARALMLRMSAEGKECVAFGRYTTTGRAASFLAPLMFFTFIDIFGADRAGMGGLCVVLAAGLLAMIAVRVTPTGRQVNGQLTP
jgi:MFS-type transporter involved in bile tolerance (Atg22 family)